jgi:hypothetical protein
VLDANDVADVFLALPLLQEFFLSSRTADIGVDIQPLISAA